MVMRMSDCSSLRRLVSDVQFCSTVHCVWQRMSLSLLSFKTSIRSSSTSVSHFLLWFKREKAWKKVVQEESTSGFRSRSNCSLHTHNTSVWREKDDADSPAAAPTVVPVAVLVEQFYWHSTLVAAPAAAASDSASSFPKYSAARFLPPLILSSPFSSCPCDTQRANEHQHLLLLFGKNIEHSCSVEAALLSSQFFHFLHPHHIASHTPRFIPQPTHTHQEHRPESDTLLRNNTRRKYISMYACD